MFSREEWTLFRSVATLGQKAGVPVEKIPRLIMKELVDNALDAAGACRYGELKDGGFFVQDNGDGIPGTPEEIAAMFSIRRPLTSSKLLRLPTRGALGNGLRVVAGAVLASRGTLTVATRGRVLRLTPQDDGNTAVAAIDDWDMPGTRVEVHLGDVFGHQDSDELQEWALRADILAHLSKSGYVGRTSAFWYDSDAFFELCQASCARTVRDLVAEFQDCSSAKAGTIAAAFRNRAASSLTREEADELLGTLRHHSKPVKPERLGFLRGEALPEYARATGIFSPQSAVGRWCVQLPFVVEVKAFASEEEEPSISVHVNRTPVTAEVDIYRSSQDRNCLALFGCNLSHHVKVGRKKISFVLNVQTPYMPITTDGKEPDFGPLAGPIIETLEKAARKVKCASPINPDVGAALSLPRSPKGRPSPEKKAAYEADVLKFCQIITEIGSTLDFRVSSRGWCYILESRCGILKGEFDKTQELITDCRKRGFLPLDICAEDVSRQFDCLETIDLDDPEGYAWVLRDQIERAHLAFDPVSFWEYQDCYLELLVEKIDLKSLWQPICEAYHIPIANAKGWSDLNTRAATMRRFKQWEAKGKRIVMLYAGDHDPAGLRISDNYQNNLAELGPAVGWDPSGLEIVRFGLNKEFIDANGLTWIENLQTGSGGDLADTKHPDHFKAYVQDYIRTYGERKCEANALVTDPDAGRQLFRDTIAGYINEEAVTEWWAVREQRQEEVQAHLNRLLRPAA